MAAGYEESPSVTTLRGRPYFFMMRFRNFNAAALSRFTVTTVSKTFVIDSSPEIAEVAVDLHADLIQVPPPLDESAHIRNPLFSKLGREHRAKPIPPKSDTTRRITSGELLK